MSMQSEANTGQETHSQGPSSHQHQEQQTGGLPAQQEQQAGVMAGSTAVSSMDVPMLAPLQTQQHVAALQAEQQQTAASQQGAQQLTTYTLPELHQAVVVTVPASFPNQPVIQLPTHDQTGAHKPQPQAEATDTTPTTGGFGESADPDDDLDETDSDGGRGRRGGHGASRTKKPHLQGRFSGRLATKDDEKRLAEECRLLAPLLGGVGKRGDRSRLTLAKIVRGIATGEVRRHLEAREMSQKTLSQQLLEMQGAPGAAQIRELQQQVAALKRELEAKNRHTAEGGSTGQMPVQGLAAAQLVSSHGQPRTSGGTSMAAFQPANPALAIPAPVQQQLCAAGGGQGINPVDLHLAALQSDLQAQEQALMAAEQGHAQAKAQAQQLLEQISKHQQDASGAVQQAEAAAQVHAQAHGRAMLKMQELQAQIQQLQQASRYVTVGPPGGPALPIISAPSDLSAIQPYVIAGPAGAQFAGSQLAGGFQILQQGPQGHPAGVRFLLSDAGGNLQSLATFPGGPFVTMGPADALAALQAQGLFRPALQAVHALSSPAQTSMQVPPQQ